MSGHSKWSQIKRQKGAADIKRGQVFTKLANTITIAVREGGSADPATNFKLRLAIDQARSVNMPKENIKRAVDRVLGGSAGSEFGQLESVVYEGYGPAKIALIVEATTDNRNRTSSEVKRIIEHSGGSFASPGSVSWMFADEGAITVLKESRSFDEIFEAAADSGAQDVVNSGRFVEVYTKPSDLENVKKALIDRGLKVESAEIAKKPSTTVEIGDSGIAKKVLALMEALESLDDVQRVYSNFDIPDELLKADQK